MTTPSFRDARRAVQAVAKATVRDQVRAHLKDIRKARQDGDSWAVIAATLDSLGVRWKSGAPIDGAALCRIVGDVERLDHGIRRHVGRPGRTHPSAAPMMPHCEQGNMAEWQKDGIPIAQLRPLAPSVPDRIADTSDLEHRLMELHQRRPKVAPPVRKITK
ncbi:hypothetical protein ABNQ39_14935 [Azospirillum sp. A26]|uniref:hypothetical protein n=1 Tax=Azospirillum sp. A26 TaxID=3160607 RepID=UPI0036700382